MDDFVKFKDQFDARMADEQQPSNSMLNLYHKLDLRTNKVLRNVPKILVAADSLEDFESTFLNITGPEGVPRFFSSYDVSFSQYDFAKYCMIEAARFCEINDMDYDAIARILIGQDKHDEADNTDADPLAADEFREAIFDAARRKLYMLHANPREMDHPDDAVQQKIKEAAIANHNSLGLLCFEILKYRANDKRKFSLLDIESVDFDSLGPDFIKSTIIKLEQSSPEEVFDRHKSISAERLYNTSMTAFMRTLEWASERSANAKIILQQFKLNPRAFGYGDVIKFAANLSNDIPNSLGQELSELKPGNLSDLPKAMFRLMYIISELGTDNKLTDQDKELVILHTELAAQLSVAASKRKTETAPMTIGDFLLRYPNAPASEMKKLTRIKNDPNDYLIELQRKYGNHVFWRRNNPAYGVIS